MPRLFFDDLAPGWSRTIGPLRVEKEEIIAFAREFDAQPFHVDEEAAKGTFVGTLIASGWHTCALVMRLIADGLLLEASSMGAPGVEEVKWRRPVLPGDSLNTRIFVLESRPSRSRPEVGLHRFGLDVMNDRGETVMRQENWILFGRRGYPWPPVSRDRPNRLGTAAAPAPSRVEDRPVASPYLDDLVIGQKDHLGSHTFTPAEIIRFARRYDPQPFHVDPEAAKNSVFGGLCASGWHTAAMWMKLMVAQRNRVLAEAARRGERPAELGPSPGFRHLKWLKPVYAGDTVAYSSTLIKARPSTSRTGWGLASAHNSGVNQHGEEVFSFDSTVFWERAP